MNCTRCQGYMVQDHFLDFEGAYGEMWASSFRCINCGHVYDAVVERNRAAQQQKVLTLQPCSEPDYQGEEVHLRSEPIKRQAA